ncbi:PASTA domain-containing protein [Flavisolibacter tropicus]|uniref:PASTA domain-containing protein n=1 Tax=Flavisolibacter tropicus TaxID=1492898 RepID=UPI001D057DBF|nr:PASTA domain-containing protein [Flavisolibacter tropicus]
MNRIIKKYITGKPLWYNILIGLTLVFLLGLIFSLSLNWITQHGVARNVPSVTGKKIDEVRDLLEDQGFQVVIQDSVYYDSLPPSVVIKQIPEPDAVVKVNRTVYVTINRTVPPDVEMPNLVGYSFRNAELVLANMGLRLGDTTFRPDFAKNSVLEQLYDGKTIGAGTKIKVGSSISLVLGTGIGNEEMAVPRLLGLTYEEAKILLESQGLILGVALPDPDVKDTANAFVYRQSPNTRDDKGRQFRIRPGQMMDIWLSAQKPNVDSLEKSMRAPSVNPDGQKTENDF